VLWGKLRLEEYQSHAPVAKATLDGKPVAFEAEGRLVRFKKAVVLRAGGELVMGVGH